MSLATTAAFVPVTVTVRLVKLMALMVRSPLCWVAVAAVVVHASRTAPSMPVHVVGDQVSGLMVRTPAALPVTVPRPI